MLTEPKQWPGGDILVTLTGTFRDGAMASLWCRDLNSGGTWERRRTFDAAGQYRINLPPSEYRLEVAELHGRRTDVVIELKAAPSIAKVPIEPEPKATALERRVLSELDRLEGLIANLTGQVIQLERRAGLRS